MASVEVEESKDNLAQSQKILELLGKSEPNLMKYSTTESYAPRPRNKTVQVNKHKRISINVDFSK